MIVAFDVETNGLFGQPFAVGGVVLDERGDTFSIFRSRCPIVGNVDQWVGANVIPKLEMHVSATSLSEMQDAFWEWWLEYRNDADGRIVVDVGYPVETGFLRACQEADPSREWEGPYPLIDLAGVLLASGIDPQIQRVQLMERLDLQGRSFNQHNPVDDAMIAALAVWRLTP
jgi:hypothetical protein